MENIFVPNTVEVAVKEIKPCKRNTKKHPQVQIDNIAESIRQFGFVQPLVLDGNKENEIIIGHGRYFAAKQLKMNAVPCVFVKDLTDEQIRKLRILDNKLNESEWDMDILKKEIEDLNFEDFAEIKFNEIDNLDALSVDDKYVQKTNIPQYEIQGEEPSINDLFDLTKTDALIEEIENSNVTDEQKKFLIEAAKRHTVFNYRKIAEYYAHQNVEMQNLMEKSALVIIDYENAIKNGYTVFCDEIFNDDKEMEE